MTPMSERKLPILPFLSGKVTESRMERFCEELTDIADKAFLANDAITQSEYDEWMRQLNEWSKLYT
jgi:hypothetical protein